MKWCIHHYESDCHGIDMIRMPSGKDQAWGGLSHPDHFSFCPLCGTPRPKEKTLEEKFVEVFERRSVNYAELGFGPSQPLQCELAEISRQHFQDLKTKENSK